MELRGDLGHILLTMSILCIVHSKLYGVVDPYGITPLAADFLFPLYIDIFLYEKTKKME